MDLMVLSVTFELEDTVARTMGLADSCSVSPFDVLSAVHGDEKMCNALTALKAVCGTVSHTGALSADDSSQWLLLFFWSGLLLR